MGRVLLRQSDISIEIDTIVPTGSSTRYVWVRGADYDEVVDEIDSDDEISNLCVVDEIPEAALVKLEWSTLDSPLFELVNEADARIVEAAGSQSGWRIQIQFPDQAALRAFIDATTELPIDIQLRQLFDSKAKVEGDEFELSPKQRETLDLAFQAGYFDIPRTVTLEVLAAELDISEQGVSERLRRGLSTFLAATLDDIEPAEGDEGPDHEEPV